MLQRDRRGSFRSFLLIVVGIFLGATLITPAVAHVGGSISHLWGAPGHIKAKVRTFGDGRWLGKTAKAADSQHADNADHATTADDADLLDGIDSPAFLQNQGSIKWAALKGWVVSVGSLTRADFFGHTTFNSGGAQSATLTLIPDSAVTLYGKSLQLTGMQLCYSATNANATLSDVSLIRRNANSGGSTFGALVATDPTDRDDDTCRTYAGTPQVMAPNSFIEVVLDVTYTGSGGFTLTRTTFFLEPTGSEIAPLGPAASPAKTRL